MKKICPVCECTFQSKTSSKFCDEECREDRRLAGQSPRQRWTALLRVLDQERVPENDMLRHDSYYFELIADGECFALDRLDNTKPHFCWNAVIPACGRCNSTRSDLYTFKQFLLLRPGLQQIRQEETEKKKAAQ
jgi:hypothetical protein